METKSTNRYALSEIIEESSENIYQIEQKVQRRRIEEEDTITVSPSISSKTSIYPSTSSMPSQEPSLMPSLSSQPSIYPSISQQPSSSNMPSSQPSIIPTSQPSESTQPSSRPSNSSQPSELPSSQPSSVPSSTETLVPSTSSSPSVLPSLSFDPTSTDSPSQVPTLIPTPTKPQFDTVTPTALPSNQPTLSPIGPASITVVSTNNTLVLNVTLSDETRLRRRLIEVSDDTIDVLEKTIESVASRDLTEGQRVEDVEVTNVISLENGEVEIIYNLALEELCGDDPCDAQNGIELFEIVTQSITDQVEQGTFTKELQENADDCVSQDCSTLNSATVLVGSFDEDPQVQKVTATPTASPSQFDPLSSKSAKRSKSAKTKASKRSGKGRKRKSKSSQSPTTSSPVVTDSSSKGSKGSSSKSQKSSKADDKKRKRKHTDQNKLIIHEKDEPSPVSSERKRRKHVTDTSFTLLVDDSKTRDEYPDSASSKIYRPMRKRKHITIAENA